MSRTVGATGKLQLPENLRERRALGRIHHLRQASAWAVVVWFPAVLVLISLGSGVWGLGIAIGGAAFSGFLRGIVASSRCPRCEQRYASTSGGFNQIWHHDRCASCGLARYAN